MQFMIKRGLRRKGLSPIFLFICISHEYHSVFLSTDIFYFRYFLIFPVFIGREYISVRSADGISGRPFLLNIQELSTFCDNLFGACLIK